VAKSLILNDSTLINRSQLIVGGVGDFDPCRPNLNLSIRKLIDIELFAGVPSIGWCIGQEIELSLVMQRQIAGDFSLLAPGKNRI